MQKKVHIKKGDTVQVLSGESKGQTGKVILVDRKNNRAVVEGVNVVKRHTKPTAAHPQGGIIEKEAPLNLSKLMVVIDGKPTRVGRKNENGKLVRYAKKSGEVIK